jgi:hypothetical protein
MTKTIHLLLIILLFPLSVFCQDESLARLTISGAVSELGISPSEEIWVATKAGNVYITKKFGELWSIGPFGSLDPYNSSTGNTFERANFFSEDTLMISGFIQEDGKQDFVYWSGNHGKTWEKEIFGKSSWIDAAYINSNGKAWMSGNSQLIYYTEDKGKTWKSFDKIEQTGNLRFSTIHFAKNEKTGLFGSFWDALYRTVDNCQSWEKLPTPLMQNKYQRLSKEERPDIRKIRIFGNHYIINQQGRTFITNTDSIDWKYLPGVLDFEITNKEQLYTINEKLTIELFDSSFSKTWESEYKIEELPRAIGVQNGKLFILTFENIYKISPNESAVSELFTNEISIPEPYLKVDLNGEEYGFDNRDILIFNKNRKQWLRFMTLDFPISNATLYNGNLIVANENLSQYYLVNENNKSIEKFELPKNLFDTSINKVVEFHFENGSQGCFHSDNARKSYTKKDSRFFINKNTASSKYLPQAKNGIDENVINGLIKIIDSSRFTKISISDLNISASDIIEFKKFIDKKEQNIKKTGIDIFDFENLYAFPGENTDFEFYKNVSDSLFVLPPETLNNAFWQAYGNWSTTTNWRRIIFVFQDGKKLVIENSDDKPNYLYTPWLVNYEGLKFRTNSIRFGQQIDELSNGQFFDKTARDKNYAIFKIADYLYRKKINKK